MTPPDKCPRCGSARVNSESFACGSGPHFNQDGFYESWDCVIRQRDQLAARVDLLNRGNETARKMICEALGMENQAGEEDILGAIGALRDRVKAFEAYAERLEKAGEAIVAEGLDISTVHRWHKAREAKP